VADILEQLRQNTETRARLLTERDQMIFTATVDHGLPVTHVAAAVGLSRQQVHNIINEQKDAPPSAP